MIGSFRGDKSATPVNYGPCMDDAPMTNAIVEHAIVEHAIVEHASKESYVG
jgi:hypothetical protein